MFIFVSTVQKWMTWTLLKYCSALSFESFEHGHSLHFHNLVKFSMHFEVPKEGSTKKKEDEKPPLFYPHFSSLLIQRYSGAVLIIISCTDRSLKLALLWHCVIDYSLNGAVIWSIGFSFVPDTKRCHVTSVCGGGVRLVHLGVSDGALWQWHEEKGALFTQKNQRHWWCHSITESFLGRLGWDILSQHFQPAYFLVNWNCSISTNNGFLFQQIIWDEITWLIVENSNSQPKIMHCIVHAQRRLNWKNNKRNIMNCNLIYTAVQKYGVFSLTIRTFIKSFIQKWQ